MTQRQREYETLQRAVRQQLRLLNGTLLPNDRPLIGKPEFLAQAELGENRYRLRSTSQKYSAVNTMTAQPFVEWVNSVPWTMASSADHWLKDARHELAARNRADKPWHEYGKLGGRPKKA
jgi:hypothetical protein